MTHITEKVMLLMNYPNAYFFPELYKQHIVHPIFDFKINGKMGIVYKVLRELHFPLLHLFYGKWKKQLRDCDKIIIFDNGYQPGMEKYITKHAPEHCKIYLFYWNPILDKRNLFKIKKFRFPENIYSYDYANCEQYDLKFIPSFYLKTWADQFEKTDVRTNKIIFLGHDKGRKDKLYTLYYKFISANIIPDIRIVGGGNSADDFLTSQHFKISYSDYCGQMNECGIILDIVQGNQSGITLRVLESIFFQKKLITNNSSLYKYDFYSSGNILLLSDKTSIQELKDFVKKPMAQYTENILDKYEFKNWVKNFR